MRTHNKKSNKKLSNDEGAKNRSFISFYQEYSSLSDCRAIWAVKSPVKSTKRRIFDEHMTKPIDLHWCSCINSNGNYLSALQNSQQGSINMQHFCFPFHFKAWLFFFHYIHSVHTLVLSFVHSFAIHVSSLATLQFKALQWKTYS